MTESDPNDQTEQPQTPGMDEYRKREYLSISSLTAFARCPRKFFYSSGVGLRPHFPHPALLFGEAIHKALGSALTEGFDSAMAAFDSLWDESRADDKRSRQRAMHMLTDFCSRRGPKAREPLYKIKTPPAGILDQSERNSDYEIPWAVDIGLDVPLAGRLDGWCEHRVTGDTLGLEFKTSSELSTRLFQAIETSPQVMAYTLALRTLSSEPVAGVLVDGLRVSKTNAETMAHIAYIEEHQLDSFVDWARSVGEMLLYCEHKGHFPKWFSGCTPYPSYGLPGFPCDFAHLCHSTDDWRNFRGDFVKSEHKGLEL